MKHLFHRFTAFTLCAVLLGAAVGCSPAKTTSRKDPNEQTKDETPIKVLTIGTADSGGTMYPVGTAIAQAISDYNSQIKINVSASTGSFDNVRGLVNGQYDLGLVTGDMAYAAYHGTEDFVGHAEDGLRAIGAVYSSISNWMAPAKSGLTYVNELTGKRLAVGPEGSTTEYSARISLAAVGLTPANTIPINCSIGYGSEEVQKGTMDAVHGFAGIPISGLRSLSKAIPCSLLKYTPEELDSILREQPIYQKAVIPAGTYPGQTEDVDSFCIQVLLCVSDSMEENLVYTLTRILDESIPTLKKAHPALAAMDDPGYVCNDLPIPLHPGAKRYYMEKGSLKP